MIESTRTLRFGEATVSVLNLGTLTYDLNDWLKPPAGRWPTAYAGDFAGPIQIPILCIHIALPGISMLVDVCDPQQFDKITEGTSQGLTERLAEIGAAPDQISHVVITHGHATN